MLLLEFNQILCEASSLRSIFPDLPKNHPLFLFLHGKQSDISKRRDISDLFRRDIYNRSVRLPAQVHVQPSSLAEMSTTASTSLPVAWVLKGDHEDLLIVRKSSETTAFIVSPENLKPFGPLRFSALFPRTGFGTYIKDEEKQKEYNQVLDEISRAIGGINSVWKIGPTADIPAHSQLKRQYRDQKSIEDLQSKTTVWINDSIGRNAENLLLRRRPAWRSELEAAAQHRMRLIKTLGSEKTSAEFLLKAIQDLELIKSDLRYLSNHPWDKENLTGNEEPFVPEFLIRCMKRALNKVYDSLGPHEQDDLDFWGYRTLSGGAASKFQMTDIEQERILRGSKVMARILAQYQRELTDVTGRHGITEQVIMESEWSDKWMANNRRLVQLVGVRALSDGKAVNMAELPPRPRLYYKPQGHSEREQNLMMQRQRDWERDLTAAVVDIIDRAAVAGHAPAYRDWLIKEYLRGIYDLEDLTSQVVHNLYKYQLLIDELGQDFAKKWPINNLDGEKLEQLTNYYNEVIRQLLQRQEASHLEKHADRLEILDTEDFQAWVPFNAEAAVLFNRSRPGPVANFCTGTGLESNHWPNYSRTGPLIQLLVKPELETSYGKWLISSSHREIRESDQRKGDDQVFAYKYPGLLKIIAQALLDHRQEIEQRALAHGLKYNISQEPENLARSFPDSWNNQRRRGPRPDGPRGPW